MNKNKVNPWMISTAVLALAVGFLIGCESPRQQVSAQTPEGITAIEMELVLNKFFPRPEDFTSIEFSITGQGNSQDFVVPAGQAFVLIGTTQQSSSHVFSFAVNGALFWNGFEMSTNRVSGIPSVGVGTNNAQLMFPLRLHPGDVLTVNTNFHTDALGVNTLTLCGYFLNAE